MSRKKDLIVRGGSNISPVEVERVLAGHPAVADVAVVGMPDDALGQRVAAFVKLADGATPRALNDILEAARTELADYKVPEHLEAIAAIPRNVQGKADRRALTEMLLQRHSGTAAPPPDSAAAGAASRRCCGGAECRRGLAWARRRATVTVGRQGLRSIPFTMRYGAAMFRRDRR